MRKIVGLLLVALLLALFATSTSVLADGPQLKLKAPRTTFMRPRMPNERRRPRVTIRISAQLIDLEDVEDLEEYYCLDEVWDWDDDTDSEYGPDCDPYEEGMELKRRFSASHQFSEPGTYTVWLRLQQNGETVIAGNTKVMIRS